MTDDLWGTDRLDLAAYLRRIDHTGPVEPTAETLRLLHRAHVAAIPFENLDVVLGPGVSVDLADIQRKLVDGARGGYCYEHSLLFGAVLDRLGFGVHRQLARIRAGEHVRARSHGMLLVTAGPDRYLADVGFGGEGLLEPIPFAAGAASTVGAWTWRLDLTDGDWVLSSATGPLYAFRVEPTFPADFAAANHVTSTMPTSPFVHHVVAQRTAPDVRYRLYDRDLTTSRADGETTTRLEGSEPLRALEGIFGIAVPPELGARLAERLA